ncbi:MAG TPA: hypothetical protein VMU12_03230 [Candidatus Paceibacterota bacterium]|nr:hypothetical protein [Candidatus Paceibacterota bacterium]
MADTTDIRAPRTAPAPTQRTLVSLAALDQQVVQVRQRNIQRQKQRRQQLMTFRRRARHTAYVFLGLLLIAAGLADLLSIVKDAVEAVPVIGWIIGIAASVFTALCVGIPMYFAQQRVKRMNEETARIAQANRILRRDLDQQFRRLRSTMQSSGQANLIQRTDPSTMGKGADFVVYKARILMNIAIVELLESVPIIDLGPWQIAKVVQVIFHQQKEFRQARAQMLAYQILDQRITLLERFEREYLEAQLSAAVINAVAAEQDAIDREQRLIGRAQRQQVTNPVTDIVPVV